MGNLSLGFALPLNGLTIVGEDGHLVGVNLETGILVTQ
jgi:hypothetical protein